MSKEIEELRLLVQAKEEAEQMRNTLDA